MKKSALSDFQRLQLKFRLIKTTEVILIAAFLAFVLLFIISIFELVKVNHWILSGGLFFIIALLLAYKKDVFKITKKEVARYLNNNFLELENSTELLLKENQSLTLVEHIQKNKIEKVFPAVYQKAKISHHLLVYLFVCVAAVVALLFTPQFFPQQSITSAGNIDIGKMAEIDAGNKASTPIQLEKSLLMVYPPVYTNMKPFESEDLNLTIPENSKIEWSFAFSKVVRDAFLVFDDGDTLNLREEDNGDYKIAAHLKKNGFYYLNFVDEGGKTMQSPFYAINVKLDQPPSVNINTPEQYFHIPYGSSTGFDLVVAVSDDYGISAAHMVATVSKGSGEAVKFREEKLHFKEKFTSKAKKASLHKFINLESLKVSPGDELYYYVVVSDNKLPIAQTSRTDTYFVTIPDTANNEIAISAGLGVDQMPEYFRSQRQIIIDTEKIIKEAPSLAKKEYQKKLNDLGIDQKLLRLRYGQFLGEEFESGITEDIEVLIESANHEDHEHGEGEEGHHHEDDGNIPENLELESYMHIHDYQGEATYFDDAIKTQLKAALAQMWEAELRLRTFRPTEALKYEYRALELIKDIQQKSRVYVERIGFEPPELKPQENRLTGDLSKIQAQTERKDLEEEELYPEMREASKLIEAVLQSTTKTLVYDEALIGRAGQELAGLAVYEPGRYLKSLQSFRILVNQTLNEVEKKRHLQIIQAAMYNALPMPERSPFVIKDPQDDLYRIFRTEMFKRQGE